MDGSVMKDVGIVQGSEAQAKEIIIGFDTVYVHSDIKNVKDGLWEYHEIQYDKDEYIALMAKNNKLLSEKNKMLEKQITYTEVALTEVYELLNV